MPSQLISLNKYYKIKKKWFTTKFTAICPTCSCNLYVSPPPPPPPSICIAIYYGFFMEKALNTNYGHN